MNIVEAYIKLRKQLVILISGFSGCGKTILAKSIERDFKLKFLNLNNFYKSDFNETVDLGHDVKVVDWDSENAIDWDKFNKIVDEEKENGVVICGFGFPGDKLKFKVDFHINLRIKKEKLIENRHKYLEENKDNPLNEIKDTRIELLILNHLTYKHYQDIKERSQYSHVLDVSELELDGIYDNVFDYLVKAIEENIYKNNQSRQRRV